MTSKEWFVNQMNFKGVDRCFCMETGFLEKTLREWPMFVTANVKNNTIARKAVHFRPHYMRSTRYMPGILQQQKAKTHLQMIRNKTWRRW
ncbi:MAG: hypothetical protein A2Y21_05190 [Clostridiales bacterium GWC2_40_7]|nr:MAG: hypothetical protein A2Y21_05190 [Clostridiales bacterium GWC2_40_7]